MYSRTVVPLRVHRRDIIVLTSRYLLNRIEPDELLNVYRL
jgi:hypothetical protein